MDEENKGFDCRMHEYRLNTLGSCIEDIKQDMKNLDTKMDERFDKLTDLIIQDKYQKQNVKLQQTNTRSNVVSAILGGIVAFIGSVVLALLHII